MSTLLYWIIPLVFLYIMQLEVYYWVSKKLITRSFEAAYFVKRFSTWLALIGTLVVIAVVVKLG